MPDTKLRPTHKHNKDKSSRFGYVNATNPNSYLNINIEFVTR